MPIDKSRLDRLIKLVDEHLKLRDRYDAETDPVQFNEPKQRPPIAEPANVPQEDGIPTQIHKSRDLFG
jgi:hypothetical protein